MIEVDGSSVGEVKQFCYLGDMLEREGDAERTVRTRVAATWNKWREISSLLRNKGIPLKNRAQTYEACIRPVLLYGAETWALTKKLEDTLVKCDRNMLRFLAGVSWRDRVTNEEVARLCRLREFGTLLKAKRLRWFGHVKRRDESEALGRVMELEVDGRRYRYGKHG